MCKLDKSLYGLKQASRKWYEKLSHFLISAGYASVTSDPTLFIKRTTSTITVLLVYVDDIVLAGNDLDEIQLIKNSLHNVFGIKDLGILKFFLGLEVAHSAKGITICQQQYCLDLLNETGTLGCKPSSIPMDPSQRLHRDDSEPYVDASEYRALVGKLLYLTSTRPDISFTVQQLCQFLDSPTATHFKAAHKVLHYLKPALVQVYFFLEILPCIYLVIVMQIGEGVLILDDLSQGTVSLLGNLWLVGNLRNNKQSLVHHPKLSIELLLQQHVNCSGLSIFSLI